MNCVERCADLMERASNIHRDGVCKIDSDATTDDLDSKTFDELSNDTVQVHVQLPAIDNTLI